MIYLRDCSCYTTTGYDWSSVTFRLRGEVTDATKAGLIRLLSQQLCWQEREIGLRLTDIQSNATPLLRHNTRFWMFIHILVTSYVLIVWNFSSLKKRINWFGMQWEALIFHISVVIYNVRQACLSVEAKSSNKLETDRNDLILIHVYNCCIHVFMSSPTKRCVVLGCLSAMNLTCNLRLHNINFYSISKFIIIAHQYTPATRSRCVFPLYPLPAFLQVNIDCVYRNWTVIWRDRMKVDSLWDSRIYRTTGLLQDYLRNDISYTARIFG